MIDWCSKSYYDVPPCWKPKHPSVEQFGKETKNHRPVNETEDRVRCQAIASALWELDQDIHPIHLDRSKIMQRFGNGREYREDTLKSWIAEADPLKGKRKSGRPENKEYRIVLEIDPKYQD